ncbi:MAG: hypothetical protein C4520_13585 [Candidatus Abyssobacteria bacterium SURF_5]|uniref:Bacterial sugar transferase domain-containing protein n=1 Tax=Abyssobacteria bacterium (strain SURF_5) TaxID=2093360 RepID=A0A3A4NCJ4_ABYX5|nr:MAG: hypothetical protein C4520_13585 [Candidatus Abyssubacteria bacterium SURF_5]
MEAESNMDVKAVVAIGGKNSRSIDPVKVPKALFPIANKPAYQYTLETLERMGIREVFLTVGDKEIVSALTNEPLEGMKVRTVVEDHPRGTAGCLKPLEPELSGHTIVLIAAGLISLHPEDLQQMILHHKHSGADLTVGLVTQGEKKSGIERVLLNGNNEIEEVVQLHFSMDRRSNMETSGIYVLESQVLEHIKPTGFMDMKEQLLPKVRKSGMKVEGWKHKQNCAGIRTIGDYLRMNFELLRDTPQAKQHLDDYQEITSQIWVGRNVSIDPTATLIRPLVIGENTSIDKNVTLIGPSVIGPGCQLKKNSFIRESVLWADSSLPSDFEVDKCLISGKAARFDTGYCRESIILNGEPFLDGIGAVLGGTTVRKVIKEKPSWTRQLNGRLYPILKRTLDLAFSGTLLLLTLPLWTFIAIAIKLDSRGPVFFAQTRCGKDARPFKMIKFRTMVQEAEEIKTRIQNLNQSDGPMFKIDGDPRETRVGRFLRRTNLDELPQLLNVLQGHMSVVGPRPLSMSEMRFNPHWRDVRLKVQQGLTGLWQIKGKSTNFFHNWIQLDLQYVDECSFLLDLKIIFLTFFKALSKV